MGSCAQLPDHVSHEVLLSDCSFERTLSVETVESGTAYLRHRFGIMSRYKLCQKVFEVIEYQSGASRFETVVVSQGRWALLRNVGAQAPLTVDFLQTVPTWRGIMLSLP